MLPRPPSSTLFPYTTLFRSVLVSHGLLGIGVSGARPQSASRPVPLVTGFGFKPMVGSMQRTRDRKSTRLNSSHPSISYAVFCLKKKRDTAPSQMNHNTQPRVSSLSPPVMSLCSCCISFFFDAPATPELYTLSLHDALPICSG